MLPEVAMKIIDNIRRTNLTAHGTPVEAHHASRLLLTNRPVLHNSPYYMYLFYGVYVGLVVKPGEDPTQAALELIATNLATLEHSRGAATPHSEFAVELSKVYLLSMPWS